MNNENGSASAVIEIGKSHTRYKHQDQLLLGFMHKPGCTAKEVAAEYYDWKYELYGDSPKRATDLSSDKLGYLTQLVNRKCRRSGKQAHTYEITLRGIAHLKSKGLLSGSSSSLLHIDPVVARQAKPNFSGLKSFL